MVRTSHVPWQLTEKAKLYGRYRSMSEWHNDDEGWLRHKENKIKVTAVKHSCTLVDHKNHNFQLKQITFHTFPLRIFALSNLLIKWRSSHPPLFSCRCWPRQVCLLVLSIVLHAAQCSLHVVAPPFHLSNRSFHLFYRANSRQRKPCRSSNES